MLKPKLNMLRHVACAALLAVVLSPQGVLAATASARGDGVLTYNGGLLGIGGTAGNLLSISTKIDAVLPATKSSSLLTRTSFDLPITGVTTQSSTALSSVAFGGGAGLTFSRTPLLGTTKTDTYTNLTFEMATKTIYADRLGGAKHMALFVGDSVSGSLKADRSFSYSLTSLNLSSVAVDQISAKLGTGLLLSTKTVLTNTEFGDFNITGVLTVPEPSTYAAFGLGLVGLLAASKRKRNS